MICGTCGSVNHDIKYNIKVCVLHYAHGTMVLMWLCYSGPWYQRMVGTVAHGTGDSVCTAYSSLAHGIRDNVVVV